MNDLDQHLANISMAIKAWDASKATDEQLLLAIESTKITIEVLRAHGANWLMLTGLTTNLLSMVHADDNRRRTTNGT